MKLLTKIVCGLYSAYCNFRLFPFRVAIKLPLQVHYKTKISACKNSIIIEGEVQRFMVKLGFGGSEGIMGKSGSNLLIKQGGTLKIREGILIAPGCSIRIERNALLCLGKNFSMNKNGFINCSFDFCLHAFTCKYFNRNFASRFIVSSSLFNWWSKFNLCLL